MNKDRWQFGPLTGVTTVQLDAKKISDAARRFTEMISEGEEKFFLKKVPTAHLIVMLKSLEEEIKSRAGERG